MEFKYGEGSGLYIIAIVVNNKICSVYNQRTYYGGQVFKAFRYAIKEYKEYKIFDIGWGMRKMEVIYPLPTDNNCAYNNVKTCK